MADFGPMKRPEPGADHSEWIAYADSLEVRVEAASSYIERVPMNWQQLEARVAELETALREIATYEPQGTITDANWCAVETMATIAADALQEKGNDLDDH